MIRLTLVLWGMARLAAAAPMLASHPSIPPSLQLTTFATGLNYPYGMHVLPDGSLLVATGNPVSGQTSLFNSNLQILRYTDTDSNGVADGPASTVFNGPAGPATGMSGAGNVIAVATGGNTGSQILLLQAGAGGAITQVGSVQFTYPGFWWHDTHAVALRETAGGGYELLFSVGSQDNAVATAGAAGLSGLTNATLNPDSVYRMSFQISGSTATATGLTQVASGLRNGFGLAFDAAGNLYIADNGMDLGGNTPLSADELNFIAAASASAVDFGFPGTYIDYATGLQVGATGTLPQVAFLPQGGLKSEGAAGMALAPSGFPSTLNNGLFVGFHGVGGSGGPANDENPVVYVDLATNTYFHFLLGGRNGQGHLNSFASTPDALFVADLSSTGSLDQAGTGAIYRIATADVSAPEPSTLWTALLGSFHLFRTARRRRADGKMEE
jgi:glucose/arabinose dehydrogenase